MTNLVDVVFEEKHFDIIGLLQVPLVVLQYSLKLIERNVTAHSDTVLLYKRLEVAFMVLEKVFLLPDHVFIVLVRCGPDLTDQFKIELILDKTIAND